MAALRAGEPILESSTRSPRVRWNPHNVKHARPAQSRQVEGTHDYEQRLDLFLFSPFNAILTIGIAAKLRGQSNSEDPRDFPACLVHRTVRSMASSETSPSKVAKASSRGKLWTSFASQKTAY
jgi:hypothetical protein